MFHQRSVHKCNDKLLEVKCSVIVCIELGLIILMSTKHRKSKMMRLINCYPWLLVWKVVIELEPRCNQYRLNLCVEELIWSQLVKL